MKKLSFLSFYLLISNLLFAQNDFFIGSILLLDESKLSGLTEIPSSSMDKTIKFRASKFANTIILKSEEIKSIEIIISDEIIHLFEYASCKSFNINKNTFILKKKKKWLSLDYETENMNVYSCGHEYFISQDGTLNNFTTFSIEFYVKKKNETTFVLAYKYDNLKPKKQYRYFINCLFFYFQDTPQLSAKIKNEEYDWDRLYEIAETYNYHMENKK